MFREDFEILKTGTIFFDNAATTLKPKLYSEAHNKYVNFYTANIHRGDGEASYFCDKMYDELKEDLGNYLSVKPDNIIFTSGTTHSLNQVVFGYYKYNLKRGDEVIISLLEHASNFLPWLVLKEELGINLVMAPLKEDNTLDLDALEKMINPKTKVISLAHITNTLGDERDLKRISNIAGDIDLVVDGAQGFAKSRINLEELNISFYAASFHKAYGPTGLGILYGKTEKLEKMKPLLYGGGMNDEFNTDTYRLKYYPYAFETGTLNVEAIVKMRYVIKYLMSKDINALYEHSKNLKKELEEKLSTIKGITIYNKGFSSSILLFNIDGVFPQDTADFLNKYKINIRAGNHCVKTSDEVLGLKNTCRISLDFYNNIDEVNKFIDVIKNKDNLYEEIL